MRLQLSFEVDAQEVAEALSRWLLEQPIYIQYVKFLWSALQGNLGTSFRYAEPVLVMIIERLPATFELAAASILLAVIVGVPLGVWAGARPNSWVDNFGSLLGFYGISMPNFWFGIMLILVVSGYFNLLPTAGRDTYGIGGDVISGFYIVDSIFQNNWAAASAGIAAKTPASAASAAHSAERGAR